MTTEKEQTGQHTKAVPPPVPVAERKGSRPRKTDEAVIIDFPPEDARTWPVPPYLTVVYKTSYFKKFFSRLLQNEALASFLTCFRLNKLIRTVNDRIRQTDSVLQFGITSGALEREICLNLNGQNIYEIEDISPVQAATAGYKYASWSNTRTLVRDFTFPREHEIRYDKVVVFFALHEMPDPRKKALMTRALNAVKEGGTAFFVDYAMPKAYNPLKYPVLLFNRVCEPFAESLMVNGIKAFAGDADGFEWSEESFFGGLYKVVCAVRKK